ncbi:MAG: phosphatidylglycerol lysyltransferase domain-containing protein [Thermodesulfobacteriota bacterium]
MIFQKVFPKNYAELAPFFKDQRYDLCSYSIASILAWNNQYFWPEVAEKDGFLVIRADYADPKKPAHLLLPIKPQAEMAAPELAALAKEADAPEVWFVTEDWIARQDRKQMETLFSVERDPRFDDYVYLASDLAELAGDKYHKKRNLIHQFERLYGQNGMVVVSPIDSGSLDACLVFLEEWCKERDCNTEDDDLACERDAAENALRALAENGEKSGWRGILLSLDGKVSALAMSSDVTRSMGSLNFEKAFSSIKGLYQVFDRECARRLFPGQELINKESDMGIPGLAKAKKSYHPIRKVKSFLLRLA